MDVVPDILSRRDLRRLRSAVRQKLLPWFAMHQRDLPWRRRRTPYRVWISESMLAQTRVDTVIPYYRRFLKRFPSLKSLATASLDDVLKQWEGLGYYTRARNLRKAAQIIVNHHQGRFPRTYEDILALPGIGPYTAAAVASLAFGLDYAVLDGNVIRVLSRLSGYGEDSSRPVARRQLQQLADQMLVEGRAGEFNEAMMELGAICCLPKAPLCAQCPFKSFCVAFRTNSIDQFPAHKSKKRVPHKEVGAAVIRNGKGQVLIAQRMESSMLGGLWEFPGGTQEPGESMPDCVARELKEEMDIDLNVGDRLMVVRHAYSHFTIALHVYWATIRSGKPRALQCADFRWCTIDELTQYAFSRADLHVVECLLNEASSQKI